jgi:surface antigen
MSTRAILIAASALAAGLFPGAANALTPMDLDADLAVDPGAASGGNPHAQSAPSTFERRPDSEYEPNATVADRRANLQCVPYARKESGVQIVGDAATWWRQAQSLYETSASPSEGGVLVLRGYNDPRRGHVAVVREIVSERMIIVDHANWLNTGEITRDVPIRDVSRAGDWSEVQVWNVEGGHWGGRTYASQGFIHNILKPARNAAAPSA